MVTDPLHAEIVASGRRPAEVDAQVALLRQGRRFRRLERPCSVGDGILRLPEGDQRRAVAAFERAVALGRFGAFIPASGAASRMLSQLTDAALARVGELPLGVSGEGPPATVSEALMARWGGVPKGLIPFHAYPDGPRTAFAEHLAELGALFHAAPALRAHFTVQEEHLDAFRAALPPANRRLDVRFSVQAAETDTIALEDDGSLVRDAQGRLVFRPGGHGALLGNLARAGFELALIKNVDNVVPDALRGPVLHWRAVIGGLLVELVAEIRALLDDLRSDVDGAEARAARFADERLHVDVPGDRDALILLLDRPARVCGMVPNDGQPGGGPFFVQGSRVPQIVEGVEVDLDDPAQSAVWRSGTHFNPVDIAVAIAGPSGAYELARFADPQASMVGRKSFDGRTLTVLEHPGLWNGQMARWNTVFVELPRAVFQPVKSLADLLGPGHLTASSG